MQTAVLGVFYIIAIGFALHVFGLSINLINDYHFTFSNGGLSSYRLLFAGSFLACLFWVSTAHMNVHLSDHYVAYMHMCLFHREWCRQCGHGMPLEWKQRKKWQKIGG